MPGGAPDAYLRVQPIFEAIAARVNNEPCVTYLGPGSAGHFVKMVHNGIEYALMQVIAESYDLLKRGFGLSENDLGAIYKKWNQGTLASYLLEITADIFYQVDDQSHKPLIDLILDEASQKGTGKWASEEAMDLQVPLPSIDTAVSMRDLSVLKSQREAASKIYSPRVNPQENDFELFQLQLYNALHAAFIICFAQGFAILQAGSIAHQYQLKLEDIARIWRGGCIIRANLLGQILSAFQAKPDLPNLLFDPQLGAHELLADQLDLRQVVAKAAHLGIPAPGLMASLAYFDTYRSAWLPASLIQAQRDYFGAHTYERSDEKGIYHTHWSHDER
jgi:6-phosphogluconate dehydrogenase